MYELPEFIDFQITRSMIVLDIWLEIFSICFKYWSVCEKCVSVIFWYFLVFYIIYIIIYVDILKAINDIEKCFIRRSNNFKGNII